MTNPSGRSFLSYRRSRIADIALLVDALHDVGIPTWQDIEDLGEGHTDEQLRMVLADADVANAVAYITPDTKESPIVTRTELPCILKRVEAKDGFFLTPVAAGGLDYADMAAAAGNYVSTDFSHWDVKKAVSDPLSPTDAVSIAQRVLKQRLIALHQALPPDAPIRLGLYTRERPAYVPDMALSLDWKRRFVTPREAAANTWQDVLLPALAAVGRCLAENAPGRPVVAGGLCALPTAVALGATFLAPRGIAAQWEQMENGRVSQVWRLDAVREATGFVCASRSCDVAADDIAVLVSVASDAEPAFVASQALLPHFRAVLHISTPSRERYIIANAGQAVDIAAMAIEGIRRARNEYLARGTVHLFLAVPAGVAFLIGQSLNTFGPVQTYEHVPENVTGIYRPAALLHPSV